MVILVIPPKGIGITGLERDQNTGHSDQNDHLLLVTLWYTPISDRKILFELFTKRATKDFWYK